MVRSTAAVAVMLVAMVWAIGTEAAQVRARRMRLQNPILEIWKSRRAMELRDGERLVQTFNVVLGLEPRMPKQIRGDNRTPVGRYYISDKRPQSRFRRFLGISYPNVEDAERGYGSRVIDAEQWADIFLANLRQSVPPWYTALGGRVGIHGHGGRPLLGVDWTEGCIAVSDEEIEFLYEVVPVGATVIIHD